MIHIKNIKNFSCPVQCMTMNKEIIVMDDIFKEFMVVGTNGKGEPIFDDFIKDPITGIYTTQKAFKECMITRKKYINPIEIEDNLYPDEFPK